MGEEIDPSKFPVDMGDMPDIFHIAYAIYRALPDRYISLGMGGSLLSGKDLSALGTLLLIYEVKDTREAQLILDIISHLNTKAILKSEAERKRKDKTK